jgi:hypothetical protein
MVQDSDNVNRSFFSQFNVSLSDYLSLSLSVLSILLTAEFALKKFALRYRWLQVGWTGDANAEI